MCAARNKKFKNILIFLTRATHIEPFSLEICIWEPFGNWFGNYLGIIWGLQLLHIFARVACSVFVFRSGWVAQRAPWKAGNASKQKE